MRRFQLALTLAMLVLVVCTEDVTNNKDTCDNSSNTMCEAGKVCCDASCRPACNSDSDCSGAQECDSECGGCTTAYRCGDGLVTGDEECDDNKLGGATCASLGFGPGSLNCNPQPRVSSTPVSYACTFDTSGCSCLDASSCDPGEDCCGGGCIDVSSDPNNCGACDVVCPVGAGCNGGNCECPPGQFDDGGTCTSCTTCVPGKYESAACTQSSDTVCLPCDPACVSCTGGTANDCDSCSGGYFDNGGVCQACATCTAGQFEDEPCTAIADTVCASCDAACATCTGPTVSDCDSCSSGYFDSAGTCTPCSTCGAGQFEKTPCGAASDTVCSACDPACVNCTGPGPGDCTECGAGQWDNGGTCTACTVCPDGQYEALACGPTTDTFCSICDPACATCSGPGATDCLTCTAGYTDCSGLCTDTDLDLNNCGSCGNTCSAGRTCSSGACVSTTPGPTVDVVTLVVGGKHYPLTRGIFPQVSLAPADTSPPIDCATDHWHIFDVPACSIDGGPPITPDFGVDCGQGGKIPGPNSGGPGLIDDLGTPDAGGVPEAIVTVTQAELDAFNASSCGT